MMRSSVYNVLDQMNKLEEKAYRYSDKAYEKCQEGNIKSSDYYDRKSDDILKEIKGFESCLKMLGFNAWKDNTGHWHIPLDDIVKVC